MSAPRFNDAIRALHGRAPYEWQERAAAELAQNGWWPSLRAPTGAGKTSLIDCWLHALALAGPDRLGRRLVWVVDRRAVVDQIYAYADRTVAALTRADAPAPLPELADALRTIGGGSAPRAVLWRGGLDDESAIAMRDPLDPAAVAVVVSTVDQLGSRLLFRGYGLGIGSRALHAGLLGLDTAVVLDEAHIAEPLRATVDTIARMQASAPRSPRPALRLCSVSATHEAEGGFELHESELREPAIARRIAASKTARLVAKGTARDVGKLVGELTDDGAKVIGVVLNTVADARAAFAQLDPQPMTDGVLLIGPVRSLERADLLAAIPDRERRAERDRPFIVVATQTIEVGVDLDFDGLITACAPLDALVQRFGRLDRAGELGTSHAFVLAPPAKGCPVYGETAEETWKWLTAVAHEETIDFGVEALRATVAEHGAPPSQQSARTIRLLDLHVDALTVTDATDEEGPDIELLLHGDRRATADVAVAWRRLHAPGSGSGLPSEDAVAQELELRPLHPGETVTLSLAALRRWLAGDQAAALSDVESIEEEGAPDSAHTRREVTGWRIAADGTVTQILDPRSISPSDRVLLSARSGGLDEFGWAPESRQEVVDLGSLALRGPRVVLDGEEPDIATVAESLASGDLTASQAARALAGPIARALPSLIASRPTFSDRVRKTAATLAVGRASLLEDGRVLVVGRGARTEHAGSGRIVTLDEHQAAVDAQAACTLAPLDLDPALRESVRRAARHHDEGKRDPRFQAWLRGGSTALDAPLAKAAYPYDPVRVRRLRESSGWPAGKRHELASAVAVERAFPEDRLAVWLVATHHGRNRPFPAAVEDDLDDELVAFVEGREIALPCAATPSPASSLQTLVELSYEYGQWGLAFLEALLMSADRTVSAAEART